MQDLFVPDPNKEKKVICQYTLNLVLGGSNCKCKISSGEHHGAYVEDSQWNRVAVIQGSVTQLDDDSQVMGLPVSMITLNFCAGVPSPKGIAK